MRGRARVRTSDVRRGGREDRRTGWRPWARRRHAAHPPASRRGLSSAHGAAAVERKKELERTNQMRCRNMAQALALTQRLVNEAKLSLRKITQAAVNEF